jgi:hypothetical protein
MTWQEFLKWVDGPDGAWQPGMPIRTEQDKADWHKWPMRPFRNKVGFCAQCARGAGRAESEALAAGRGEGLGLHQVAFCFARRRRMYSAITAL